MTVPLGRDRITALLAAAHTRAPQSDAGDPYLQKRLDDAATIARWEERIRRAAVHAFGRWTTLARAAVLDGTRQTLTADADGEPTVRTPLPPDPNALASLGPAWDQIAQASIVTSVGDLLGETFGQYLLDGDGVISARAWSEGYLAGVSNRLSGIPDQTFDRVRADLQEGHDKGESIPRLRDRVAATLSTRQGGDANFYRQRATTIARTECLPADTVIEGANITAVYRRPYSGPWVTVHTQGGRQLSGTPNHPVLTARGWVGLGELTERDHLVCDRGDVEGPGPAGHEDVQGGPATLGEIFDAVAAVAVPVRVAGGKPDFHGDGAEGYVEVLRPDGVLRLGRFTALQQGAQQVVLEQPHLVPSGPAGLGDGFRRSLPVDQGLHLFTAAEWDALLAKHPGEHLAVAAEPAAQVVQGSALTVERRDEGAVHVVPLLGRDEVAAGQAGGGVLTVRADVPTVAAHDVPDAGTVDPERGGQGESALPGRVSLDQVRLVRRGQFTGHVYNLTCEEGYFAAGHGLVTSNTTGAMNGGHMAAWRAMATAKAKAALTGDDGADDTGGGDAETETGTKVWVATMDERTRPSHVAADGQTRPINKPFDLMGGQLDFPGDGNGPASETVNCLVPGSVVDWSGQQVLGTTRRRYSGPLVQLVTGRGHVLTVTPNHPVLTAGGYVAAGQLRPGQQVIAADRALGAQPQVADRPARVEELHGALRQAGSEQRVVGRRVDFHGDGVEGEQIEVVRADRDLLAHGDSEFAGAGEQGALVGLGDAAPAVPGAGGAVVAFPYDDGAGVSRPTAAGFVRGERVLPAPVRGESGGAKPVGLAAAADGEFQLGQAALDDRAADAEVARHLLHAHALGMSADELVEVEFLAGYHGDVYNLSTTDEWYTANGIACHNCRCTVMYLAEGDPIPGVPGGRQLGQDTEGFRDGVAEAADERAAALSEVDAEIAAETDAETGNVLEEADADAQAAAEATTEPGTEPVTEPGTGPGPAEEAPQAAGDDPAPAPVGETPDAAALDPEGAPYRLTYDYLSGLSEDQLDTLTDRIVTGLAEDNPLEGARWDDLSLYLETTERVDTLASELGAQGFADDRITSEVDRFLTENGRPGLTHPDVGGAPPVAKVTRAQVQDEYAVFLEAQYVRASDYTRGHMLSPAGRARHVDPRELFGGSKGGIRETVRYASAELLEFWENEPRVSWAEFYYQRTGSQAWAEKAAKAARDNAGIGRDRINPLTAAASSTVAQPTPAQVRAYRAGRAAYDAGEPSTTCPHDLVTDPQGLGLLWVRGYVFARRDALGAAAVAAGLLDNAGHLVGPRQLTPAVTAAPQTPAAPAGQDDPAGAPAHPTPEGPAMPPRTWRSDPFLAPFAVPTGDGRIFAVGSLTSRELPLPLLYQDSSAPGHDQSVVVGRITDVQFTDTGIVASGDYLDDPSVADVVSKAIALVEAGLGGVSVDLAACTGELVDTDGNPVTMEAIFQAWDNGEDPEVLEQVTAGELIAVTQVATPAFAGAKIAMGDAGAPADDAAPGLPESVAPADGQQAAALEAATAATAEFSGMKDAHGKPLTPGSIVQVTLDADGKPVDPLAKEQADEGNPPPAGQASPAQEAAAPPAPPSPKDAPLAKPADATTTTVKGRVTNIDAKVEKITVQPEDDTAEPLVVAPQYVVCLDAGDAPAEDKPDKPAAPAGPPAQGASIDGAETFAVPADTTPDLAKPDAAPKADAAPAGDEEDSDVQAVEGADDLALLTAVAPHYDEAAKLVTAAFAGIKDDRLKAIAADLVEDAAEWRALLDYGLTPDDDDTDPDALAAAALVAAAGPLQPPAAWFENPQLSEPTAITVTDDGRVYGHAAVWGTCHVGYSRTCITPPPSPSSYAYFHTGEVVCADGSRVAVGNLTLGGRHADVQASYRSAIEHYDVQGAGVAVVRMYEDEHGIAFAGSLTPGVTAEQVYDLRRSPVSGDWRRVGGNLEMIGCLSVNAPGFPTPRFRTDTAGRTALTAAPSVRPTTTGTPLRAARGGKFLSADRLSAAIQSQISKEVAAEIGRQRAAEQRAKRLQVATVAVKGDPRARMAALSASVDGGRSQARRNRVAELAGLVTA